MHSKLVWRNWERLYTEGNIKELFISWNPTIY